MEKLNPQKIYVNQKTQVISLEKGKIPPQAIDLEEVVLGAMMVEANNLSFTYEQNPLYEVVFYITLCVCVACLIGGLVSFRWLTKKRQPGERNVRGNNLKTSLISENDAKSDGNNV